MILCLCLFLFLFPSHTPSLPSTHLRKDMENKQKEFMGIEDALKEQVHTLTLRLRAAESTVAGLQAHFQAREAQRTQRIADLSSQVCIYA